MGIFWRRRQRSSTRRTWRERFSGLQWRMTFSYVWITIASVLVFSILLSGISIVLVPLAIAIGLILWLRSRARHLSNLQPRVKLSCIQITIAIILMIFALCSVINGAFNLVALLKKSSSQASNILLTSLQESLLTSLLITLILLIVLAPLGGIFGFISTRGLVRRLKSLASATTLVADGDYQQRLPVASKDEVGQLEQQFNRMAEQLGESITRQKELAEENARLAERSRISRELHDAISQDLFSLSLLAGGLQSALPSDSPLQRQAGILEQTTNNTIREMRALLLELRPTRLEQLSLVAALEELAEAYSTRLGIQVKTELTHTQLEARREHTLLRIVQESLANAARHANATKITITLTLEEKHARLSLRDNGKGFQTNDESLRHGLGLLMMQERVQELQGSFKLESAPDQGTALEILLPLEEAR